MSGIRDFKCLFVYRLAMAESELSTVMAMLKEKQDQLAEVEAKIAELQKTYDESVAEKQKLERNIAQTASRLKRAAKLTTALGDEQIRWDQTVKVGIVGYGEKIVIISFDHSRVAKSTFAVVL